jgi:hypothetical protein
MVSSMEQLSQQRNRGTSLAVERSRLTREAMANVDAGGVIDHQAVQDLHPIPAERAKRVTRP